MCVRAYAHQEEIPLGLDALESEPDDKTTATRSTQDRAIRRKTRRVLKQVLGLVFPLVEYLVVALLPEDAAALDNDYQPVTDI